MLFWTLRTTLAFDFVLLWRCLYLFTACALLVVTFAQRGPILWTASSIATDPLIPSVLLAHRLHDSPPRDHTTIPGGECGVRRRPGSASYAGQLVGRVIPEIRASLPCASSFCSCC